MVLLSSPLFAASRRFWSIKLLFSYQVALSWACFLGPADAKQTTKTPKSDVSKCESIMLYIHQASQVGEYQLELGCDRAYAMTSTRDRWPKDSRNRVKLSSKHSESRKGLAVSESGQRPKAFGMFVLASSSLLARLASQEILPNHRMAQLSRVQPTGLILPKSSQSVSSA